MKDKLLAVLKLFFAILLLPVVIGVTASLWQSLHLTESAVSSAFGWGVVVYLIQHILLYEPAPVYETGNKMTEKTLEFFSPLVKVAGLCIPIFTILTFILYFLALKIWPWMKEYFSVFVFVGSFTLTMHIVFTANSLKGKKAGWLRENYFFAIFFIYIINILIVAGIFCFLTNDFYFVDFVKFGAQKAGAIYTASFKQLFDVDSRLMHQG